MNHESPIRAILFDYGGVIADEGFYDGLGVIARKHGLDHKQLHKMGMDSVFESGFVLGKGTEAEFWDLLRMKSGITDSDDELRDEILPRFRLRPWMIDTIRDLRRQGYIIGLLSDQVDWLDWLNAEQDFLKEFDQLFISNRMGKGKRDPTVFDDVVNKLGLRPQQTLFIDDAEGNVERAASRGLKVIRYTGRESFESQLQSQLGHDQA